VIVLFNDKYYLFASKADGYYSSDDMVSWRFLTDPNVPWLNYAPTAFALDGYLYYMGSQSDGIHRTADPETGGWEEVTNYSFPLSEIDPAVYVDTDGKVYYYYGCSPVDPMYVVELDKNNQFRPMGNTVTTIQSDPANHGWENFGDYNTMLTESPWLEGSWMNLYNGKYYLQYAMPGTELKSYAGGVYTADNPLGPFTYAQHNPFSSRPEGFLAGAGHGATFEDKYGNYWHIATSTISVKDIFERRLSLFPAMFDEDGDLVVSTTFGDYPKLVPQSKFTDFEELRPGWMMLSYNKNSEVSSELNDYSSAQALNEDIRTYWSAETGDPGEWFMVDLDTICEIHAIQLNLAEHLSDKFGRENIPASRYLIEYSPDEIEWNTGDDQTQNDNDLTHQLKVFDPPISARYVKVTNHRVSGGTFAISGFRVFGYGKKGEPSRVTRFLADRPSSDPRRIELTWRKSPHAIGYNIRYGYAENKLYHTYQVYTDTNLTIYSLNRGTEYWFRIDAFSEGGIIEGVPRLVELDDPGSLPVGQGHDRALGKYLISLNNKSLVVHSLSGITPVRVFDLAGKEVVKVNTSGRIDISRLPGGIYFLKIGNVNRVARFYLTGF
jgi:hypothetical protein